MSNLACVSCFFNPNNYKRILNNYWEFKKNFSREIPLFTIEAAFQEFQTDASVKIKAYPNNQIMFQKERLLNILIDKLPDKYDKVMFSDCDLLYEDGWEDKLYPLLEEYKVVQCFNKVNWLGPDGKIDLVKKSAVSTKLNKDCEEGLPGFCWAFDRNVPLYERAILGNGDQLFERAITGNWAGYSRAMLTPREVAYYVPYANHVFNLVGGSYYYLDINIKHLFHGTWKNRDYINKHRILKENNFDPVVDLQVGGNGLLSWCSYKPKMHFEVKKYFALRKEDE